MSDTEKIKLAAERLVAAMDAMHVVYPNTATCRSGPGVIAGQAMTPHCAWTCRVIGSHHAERTELMNARVALLELVGAEIT